MIEAAAYRWSDRSYAPFDDAGFAQASESPLDADSPNRPLLSAAIFVETNRVRAEHGLRALAYEPHARAAAQGYCDDMVRLRFYDPDHGHPDPALATPKQRMDAAGVQGASGWAENIAVAFPLVYTAGDSFYPPDRASTAFRDLRGEPLPAHSYATFARALVAQWMASPHHRANLLDADWTHLGAACAPYRGADEFPKLACAEELARIDAR